MTADNPSFPRPSVIPAKAGIQTPVAIQLDYLKRNAADNAGLSHMDFGELGQDVDEEVVVPAGPFQFAAHGAFARLQPR